MNLKKCGWVELSWYNHFSINHQMHTSALHMFPAPSTTPVPADPWFICAQPQQNFDFEEFIIRLLSYPVMLYVLCNQIDSLANVCSVDWCWVSGLACNQVYRGDDVRCTILAWVWVEMSMMTTAIVMILMAIMQGIITNIDTIITNVIA